MANEFYGIPGSTGPATGVMSKIYSANYIKALYDKPGAWKKLRSFTAEVQSQGQSVLIPLFPRLTAQNISTTDGSITAEDTAISRQEMIINYFKGVDYVIPDNVLRQSQIPDLAGQLANNAAAAINDVLDKTIVDDIIPLIDNSGYAPNNYAGSLGSDLTDTVILDALAILVKNHVDMSNPSDFVWILPASQFGPVHALKGYTNYRIMPGSVNTDGGSDVRASVDSLYGIDVHFRYDTGMSVTGGRLGGLFYKDSVAVAIQKNIGLAAPTRVPRTVNWDYLTYALYGMKLIKPEVSCQIRTK